MKAVVLPAKDAIDVRDVPRPPVGKGEVRVRLKAAALNHRDVWIFKGEYAGLRYPCTPGSDGAGIVSEVGEEADPSWMGREVIINPSLDWGENPRAQADAFTILGLPRDGTFAEEMVVPVEQLAPKPGHLSWEQAAALPLAGLTAYRALFSRAALESGEKVLISGIGGGVAVFALQFSVAAGAKVWVTSSSQAKIDRAVQLGAQGGFLYTEQEWRKAALQETGGVQVIVDSAGGPGFGNLIDVAAAGARIAFYGATRGDPPLLPMRKVFWRQLSLLGTTMGSPDDWAALGRFVERHAITPVVSDIYSLDRAPEAFARMQRGEQFGKIVLAIA